jgi:hypothetical protein
MKREGSSPASQNTVYCDQFNKDSVVETHSTFMGVGGGGERERRQEMYVSRNIQSHSDLRFLDFAQIQKTCIVFITTVNFEASNFNGALH